jgi:hypothetical protein
MTRRSSQELTGTIPGHHFCGRVKVYENEITSLLLGARAISSFVGNQWYKDAEI